jgi:hypothetical protein
MAKRLGAVSLFALLVSGSTAFAADHLIPGKKTTIRQATLAKFVSNRVPPALFPTPVPGSVEDPTLHGAEIRFFDIDPSGAGEFVHALPAAGWSGRGNPPGSKGYTYSGAAAGDTVCKLAHIRGKKIKAICKSPTIPLDPPFAGINGGTMGIILGVPSGTAGAAIRYCAEFGGDPKRNNDSIFRRKNAPAPPDCPEIVGPTPSQTPTSTPTITPPPTPTFTSPPGLHKCVQGPGSDLKLYSAAFPVPITINSAGSALDIGGVGSIGECSIQNFLPVSIISIGFVCIQPAPGCSPGARHCGPGAGPALGVDAESDGNVATCTGQLDCETQCDATCPVQFGVGFARTSSGCTGFCTDGAQSACTADAQCDGLGEGSCSGPDNPGVNAGKCQCNCLKTDAFGPSDPGDLQCNLGASITVEATSPCDGSDLLINVGSACIPYTTQRAKGKIIDGNFIPGSTVPGPAPGPDSNDQTGAALACATLDTSTTTGWIGVGAVNFFGTTIGDLAVGVRAVCQ